MGDRSNGEIAVKTTSRPEAIERALAELRDRGCETLIVGTCDTHGVMRGKRVPAAQIRSALEGDVHLCDVLWVIDVAESDLVPRPAGAKGYFPTAETGFPDLVAIPDLETLRQVPWHERTALVLAELHVPGGEVVPIAPRAAMRRLVERLRGIGLEAEVGLEYEFYVLRETPDSLAGKRPDELVPLSPRASTYGVVEGSAQEQFARRIREALRDFEIPVEACNPETGPGQFEINLHHAPALAAADHAFLFRTAIKELAAQQGMTATFMAKPRSEWAGSSCHVHMSLCRDGVNAFADEDAPDGISSLMRSACAGILATLPELTALCAPTVNSYRRFQPYSWAGTTRTWGVDNRSVALRAVCESPASTRLEHRQGGGDVNPYLAVAAMLAGALHGIEHGLEPPPPRRDDVYALAPGEVEQLPRSLESAVAALDGSAVAREYLGADLVDHYVALKRAECEAAALAVTDWEIDRYIAAI